MTFCASGSRRALGGNSRVESSANHLTAITKDITDTAACLKACGYANSKAKYSIHRIKIILGRGQAVRHLFLVQKIKGSNPFRRTKEEIKNEFANTEGSFL